MSCFRIVCKVTKNYVLCIVNCKLFINFALEMAP